MKKLLKSKLVRKQKIIRFFTIGIWTLAIILAIIAGAVYTSIPAVKNAIVMATTIKPETFTELYFENHLSLPKKIVTDQENNFKFTVHNLEYKTMTYPYEVYIKCSDAGCNGEKQIIDEGKITLKHDEYKTISESYMITLPTGRIEIVANLINKKQGIDFWVEGDTQTSQLELSKTAKQPQPASTTVQPQLLTDFYFDISTPLPILVTQNQIVSFAFTVHNSGYQDVNYPYDIYIEENGQTTPIDKDQFTLKPDEYKTISQSHVMMVTPGALAKIYIKLTNENRYINFEVKGL